jgi:hypothetical protein
MPVQPNCAWSSGNLGADLLVGIIIISVAEYSSKKKKRAEVQGIMKVVLTSSQRSLHPIGLCGLIFGRNREINS